MSFNNPFKHTDKPATVNPEAVVLEKKEVVMTPEEKARKEMLDKQSQEYLEYIASLTEADIEKMGQSKILSIYTKLQIIFGIVSAAGVAVYLPVMKAFSNVDPIYGDGSVSPQAVIGIAAAIVGGIGIWLSGGARKENKEQKEKMQSQG